MRAFNCVSNKGFRGTIERRRQKANYALLDPPMPTRLGVGESKLPGGRYDLAAAPGIHLSVAKALS